MKVMLLDRPRQPLRLADVPTPRPAAGQLLLRVRACGVCRTDLHVVDGELTEPKLPLVPGHEIVGVVEQAQANEALAALRGGRIHGAAVLVPD